MQYSVSRVQCFQQCQYKFKLKYLDKLSTYPDYDDPANALYLGTALHTGLEKNLDEAIESYFNSYPIITDAHINEAIKLEYLIPKAKKLIPNGRNEVLIENEVFKGFIDLLVVKGNGHYDIWDFKYSNNKEHYMESYQLHVYKSYFEGFNHGKVDNLYYLFIPKTAIRQKKTESLEQFRRRLKETLEKMHPEVVEVPANEDKVKEFLEGTSEIENATEYQKNESGLCSWCEYLAFCKGENDLCIDWENSPFIDWADYRRNENG